MFLIEFIFTAKLVILFYILDEKKVGTVFEIMLLGDELHIYSNAAHGFGLRTNNKGPLAMWQQRLVDWLYDTMSKSIEP